jgi:hypothetical protein
VNVSGFQTRILKNNNVSAELFFVTVHAKEKKSYALKGQRMLTHRSAVG